MQDTKSKPGRPAASTPGESVLLRTLHGATVTLVVGGNDLTARQLAVLLTVYLDEGPHTVRGLAGLLDINKPAITRALDRLGEMDLARRKIDPMDRRMVLVQRTIAGAGYVRKVEAALAHAAAVAEARSAEG